METSGQPTEAPKPAPKPSWKGQLKSQPERPPVDVIQEVPKEAPKQEEPPKEEEKDQFSPKFAALTKKERELRGREAELQKMESELKSQGEQTQHIKDAIANAKKDPEKLFEVAGMTYQDVVEYYLKDAKTDGEKKIETLEEKLDRLEKEREEEKKQQEEQSKEQEEKQKQEKVAAFHKTISDTLQAQGDKYELTRVLETPEAVYNVMVDHYLTTEKEEGTGRTLSIEEAAEQIEKRLEDHVSKIVKESPKLQKILGMTEPETKKESVEDIITRGSSSKPSFQNPIAGSGSRTLSNEQFRDRPVRTERRLGRDESIKVLAEKLRQQRLGVNKQ